MFVYLVLNAKYKYTGLITHITWVVGTYYIENNKNNTNRWLRKEKKLKTSSNLI